MNRQGLPDRVVMGLPVLVCGDYPDGASLEAGHYYADGGNRFWDLLYDSGLTTEALGWEDDGVLPELGIGLTDLNKADAHGAGHVRLAALVRAGRPGCVAFNGRNVAEDFIRQAGTGRRVEMGLQDWGIAGARVYVLPGSSGADTHTRLVGRDGLVLDRPGWWARLAEHLGRRSDGQRE
ncbi:mismatch-specific DNA-glycosylase [Arthrobacter sp. I2-34]|uniref:Mismatch-specific DNA-glycosylase n=1 Tax=Arthrobacter hankyongi TaxID=2904801 RepID=A0ABS9L937_9MICC|nr:mismatch-specific DNA-glycosylase [Arthrobacter hankyongi]MCG2623028.1 mismatch-specific DNA-glycosylase [Arthrobacter hankyongi]